MGEIEKAYIRERIKALGKLRWFGISEEDAEDIVQDAAAGAIENLNGSQDVDKFTLFFWRKIKDGRAQHTRNWERKTKAKDLLNTDDELETEMLDDQDEVTKQPRFDIVEEDKSDGMANTLENEEEDLIDSLEKMPESVAEVMYQRFVEHLSVEEIAKELKLSTNTVNQYLSQGRKILKNDISN